jgi:ParB-like chromosome segregation protein Spo0J
MAAYELRTVALGELKPPPGHPRRAPTAAAHRRLKAGLAAFGLVAPVVWNEQTGHLVDGAARLRGLAELGIAEVPVAVVRLSAARERALALLLNNPRAQGRFDAARLAAALADLGAADLALSGFDRRAARALRFEPAAAPPAPRADRVEVTLVTDATTFAALAGRLDVLIGDHQLVAHVRRA